MSKPSPKEKKLPASLQPRDFRRHPLMGLYVGYQRALDEALYYQMTKMTLEGASQMLDQLSTRMLRDAGTGFNAKEEPKHG